MGAYVKEHDFGTVDNCATPDAEYSVEFGTQGVIVKVRLPRPGMTARLSQYQRGLLRRRLHDAVLPSIELIYAAVWEEMFAGQGSPPFPDKHTDMHADRH